MNNDYPAMEDDLVRLGEEGWEFCQLYNGNCFVFKRPK